ncbi:MAG: Gp37 family protein [Proteobacteria bacterium]|jgi:hypothetical protein|nr:Gp37 family protein [Pseudomonadota bacterium]
MATTLEIIEAVIARLKEKLPALAVEYFPEKPRDYRLNHPGGALLVSYAGSRYSAPVTTTYVMQPRELRVTVTVVMRQLNGRGGAVDAVDAVRLTLLGHRLPDCKPLRAVADTYLGEAAGLWQYAVDFAVESVALEDVDAPAGPAFTGIELEETK